MSRTHVVDLGTMSREELITIAKKQATQLRDKVTHINAMESLIESMMAAQDGGADHGSSSASFERPTASAPSLVLAPPHEPSTTAVGLHGASPPAAPSAPSEDAPSTSIPADVLDAAVQEKLSVWKERAKAALQREYDRAEALSAQLETLRQEQLHTVAVPADVLEAAVHERLSVWTSWTNEGLQLERDRVACLTADLAVAQAEVAQLRAAHQEVCDRAVSLTAEEIPTRAERSTLREAHAAVWESMQDATTQSTALGDTEALTELQLERDRVACLTADLAAAQAEVVRLLGAQKDAEEHFLVTLETASLIPSEFPTSEREALVAAKGKRPEDPTSPPPTGATPVRGLQCALEDSNVDLNELACLRADQGVEVPCHYQLDSQQQMATIADLRAEVAGLQSQLEQATQMCRDTDEDWQHLVDKLAQQQQQEHERRLALEATISLLEAEIHNLQLLLEDAQRQLLGVPVPSASSSVLGRPLATSRSTKPFTVENTVSNYAETPLDAECLSPLPLPLLPIEAIYAHKDSSPTPTTAGAHLARGDQDTREAPVAQLEGELQQVQRGDASLLQQHSSSAFTGGGEAATATSAPRGAVIGHSQWCGTTHDQDLFILDWKAKAELALRHEREHVEGLRAMGVALSQVTDVLQQQQSPMHVRRQEGRAASSSKSQSGQLPSRTCIDAQVQTLISEPRRDGEVESLRSQVGAGLQREQSLRAQLYDAQVQIANTLRDLEDARRELQECRSPWTPQTCISCQMAPGHVEHLSATLHALQTQLNDVTQRHLEAMEALSLWQRERESLVADLAVLTQQSGTLRLCVAEDDARALTIAAEVSERYDVAAAKELEHSAAAEAMTLADGERIASLAAELASTQEELSFALRHSHTAKQHKEAAVQSTTDGVAIPADVLGAAVQEQLSMWKERTDVALQLEQARAVAYCTELAVAQEELSGFRQLCATLKSAQETSSSLHVATAETSDLAPQQGLAGTKPAELVAAQDVACPQCVAQEERMARWKTKVRQKMADADATRLALEAEVSTLQSQFRTTQEEERRVESATARYAELCEEALAGVAKVAHSAVDTIYTKGEELHLASVAITGQNDAAAAAVSDLQAPCIPDSPVATTPEGPAARGRPPSAAEVEEDMTDFIMRVSQQMAALQRAGEAWAQERGQLLVVVKELQRFKAQVLAEVRGAVAVGSGCWA